MKRRSVILAVTSLALACVAGRFLTAHPRPGPVAISFTGYTNEPAGTEAAAAAQNEPEAIFHLTNRTGSGLQCAFDFQAVCTNGLSSRSGGEYYLAAHEARRLLMVTPVATNGWRFEAVFSVSGPRPLWQQRAGALLSRLGLHPVSLAGDRKYPQFTNVWTSL